ncbi:hypothetical protein WJX77_008450 [Trebouxia sp. C0004]
MFNSGSGSSNDRPAKRLRQPTIADTLANKRATDLVVAEFFYGTGIPLHLVRSPLFKKMSEVISSSNVPYKGPAYNAMRTDLGTKFLRALDTSGNGKNGQFIADKMSEIIEEVGSEYISVVVMDGASSNVSANEFL